MDATSRSPSLLNRAAAGSFVKLPVLIQFFQGLMVVGLLMFWGHLLVTTWGLSGLTLSAFPLGFLLALGTTACLTGTDDRVWSRPVLVGSLGLLTLLTATVPLWWDLWDHMISACLQRGNIGWWIACLLNSMLLAIPLVSGKLMHHQACSEARQRLGFWLGLACGCYFVGLVLAVFVPLWIVGVIAAACAMLLQLLPFTMPSVSPVDSTAVDSRSDSGNRLPVSGGLYCGLVLLAGCLCPLLWRIVSQLQPETTLLYSGAAGGICLGWAIAWNITPGWKSLLKTALLLTLVVALFPLWIRFYLAVAAHVAAVPLGIVLRQTGLLAFSVPLGLLLGQLAILTNNLGNRREHRSETLFAALFVVLLVGGACLATMLLPQLGIGLVWSGAAGSLGLLLAIWAVQNQEISWNFHSTAGNRWKLGSLAAMAVLSAVVPFSYAPSLSARVLFSTHMFNAWRTGSNLTSLAGMDDGRLLASVETSGSTLTVWRHQGTHYQIRENGVPAGRISGDDRLVPQPTGAVLSAVLPLSIHAAPRDVLLLGMESGLSLKTVLDFPVLQVTCIEPNAGLIRLSQQRVLAPVLGNLLTDDRLTLLPEQPAVALRRDRRRYDVILETTAHSALYSTAHRYSETHYRLVRERLSAQGLYCQRFSFADYGPDVLRSVADSLAKTFGYVTAFDTAPGEILFIAARQQDDVLSAGLMDRLAAPQVVRNLARIGWDWSVATNLARFEVDDLQQVRGFGPLNAWQGRGPFARATEMLRWGNKWGEVQAALAHSPKRLLEHYQEEKVVDDILRRLSDVAAREQVLVRHPDQFWVYRKSVQKRLVDKPRSVIVPVKGEGLQQRMHPEDRRRMDYFETLGQVSQQRPCTLEGIASVTAYESPYDPLISHFLHAEVAKLYQRSDPVRPDRELMHWLHALYFGSQQERSVRDIHRCVELLATAEVRLTEAERYDQLNTLLELLKIRWQMRKGRKDISQTVLLLDLKDSLTASQTALSAMEKFGQSADIDSRQTQLRVEELNRSLVRMLKSYRVELLARASQPGYPLPSAAATGEQSAAADPDRLPNR